MRREIEMAKRIKSGSTRKSKAPSFHLRLKHVLGGISLLSLLAAFEVFSIPAGNGIIDFFDLNKTSAALIWFGVSLSAGFAALILHKESGSKY
jgi:hypothetical protein